MNNVHCQYLDLANPLLAIGFAWLAIMLFLVVDALAPPRKREGLPRHLAISRYFAYFIVALAACKIIAWLLFASLPIFGWDSIDLWLPEAIQNIQWFELGECPDKRPDNRHPQATSLIFAGLRLIGETGNFYFNIILLLSIAFIIPMQKKLFSPLMMALSFVIVFLPFPLLEAHILIVGYSDFLLCIVFTLCVNTLMNLVEGGYEIKHLAAAGLSIFLLGMVKNSGFLLAIIAVCSAIYVRLAGDQLRLGVIVSIFAPLCGFLLISTVGEKGWLENGAPQIRLGGWDRELVINAGLDVVKSEIFSLFVNQSFSTLPLAVIFIVLLSVIGVGATVSVKTVFLITVFIAVEWALIGFQLFTAHGFHYAVPHNDTGGSRFKMPLILLSTMIIADAAMKIRSHGHATCVIARSVRQRGNQRSGDD